MDLYTTDDLIFNNNPLFQLCIEYETLKEMMVREVLYDQLVNGESVDSLTEGYLSRDLGSRSYIFLTPGEYDLNFISYHSEVKCTACGFWRADCQDYCSYCEYMSFESRRC